jgi:hypothetical protein
MFDYEIPEDRLPEIDARFAEAMLTRIVQLDDRPLTEERPPERRLVGCCRDAGELRLLPVVVRPNSGRVHRIPHLRQPLVAIR